MKAQVIGPQSKLLRSRCRHCPHPLRAGETVLWQALAPSDVEASYGHNLFVVHTGCIEALLATAPKGRAPLSPSVRFRALRQAMIETGDPFVELPA